MAHRAGHGQVLGMTSKHTRFLARLLILLATVFVIPALVSACGSSKETAKFGNTEVSIPSNLHTIGEKMRAVLKQEPYEKWAANCMVDQFEKILTPEDEEELKSESEAEFGKFLQPHLQEINQACERPGRHILNPHATEAQIETIRSAQAAGLRIVLEGANAPQGEIECVEEKFEELPGPKVIESIEAPEAQRQAIYMELGSLCQGH
jgi:preprotein translocase subunit SecG